MIEDCIIFHDHENEPDCYGKPHYCRTHGTIFDAPDPCPMGRGAQTMKLKFKLTFKSGIQTIAVVEGLDRHTERLLVEDMTENVIKTEQYLERLTGLRVHIEQVL